MTFTNAFEWFLGGLLIISSLGIIIAKKPVQASLSFLMTLITLAALYLQLSAHFTAAIQVLIYAGAILVIFIFVIVLFQDAYKQIERYQARSSTYLLVAAGGGLLLALLFFGAHLIGFSHSRGSLPEDYGSVQSLGRALYLDFFFPFEAITLVFLVAIVGALYIGKKEH